MINDHILNTTRLLEIFDEDDVVGLAQFLGMARQTEERHLATLHEALAGGDFITVAKAAHSIKGSAANIGASAVSAAAAGVEDAARRVEQVAVAERVGELDRAFTSLCERISEYAAATA